jgi:MFS family permease
MKMSDPDQPRKGPAFWKISGAGASFQAGSAAIDSATIIASLVYQLTGSVFAVGAASAILRLGWLVPQMVVGFLAGRTRRRMPLYAIGAFGRTFCIALIAVLFTLGDGLPAFWMALWFLVLWTIYAFVSGIVAVPYNDIVGRSIPSGLRSRMLAYRFFGGGILALGVAAIAHRVLATADFNTAYAVIFSLATLLMLASSFSFLSAGEPALPPSALTGERRKFAEFLKDGLSVLATDRRFRLFLYSQWLGGASLMVLPFYVVAASTHGLQAADVAALLAAQTVGSLVSNAAWGRIGDRHGKRRLLEAVGVLRLIPPAAMITMLTMGWIEGPAGLVALAMLFFVLGAMVTGMTIGYLGYLMEISPDDRRPAYSAYFNALASPAALLPLLGAVIVHQFSLNTLFALALAAAVLQLGVIRALADEEAK